MHDAIPRIRLRRYGGGIPCEDVSSEEVTDKDTINEWTPEDFTYNNNYEKRLYGCDYSRDFVIKGTAISGFSESGLKKLENNKNLVIPGTDIKGDALVGIDEGAFKNRGITTVKFPENMMIDYDDTLTHSVTKRGNFVIGDSAFSGNNLTSVDLPKGVIAVLPNAFLNNKIESVKLPTTIWWIENQSFAKNRITTVDFPVTCDFQLEIHGMAFANNMIKSVKLPYYTAVVFSAAFALNTGMESIADSAPDNVKLYEDRDNNMQDTGIVYMYSDNPNHTKMDRINHDASKTESQHSYYQRLIINEGATPPPGVGGGDSGNTPGTGGDSKPDEMIPDEEVVNNWVLEDFVIEGTCIKGLSEQGEKKRANEENLVLPKKNKDGEPITEIAAAEKTSPVGIFATKDEKFKRVVIPQTVTTIGDFAFKDSGLESVNLPDSVTSIGIGSFMSNPEIKLIRLSTNAGFTTISRTAFSCAGMDGMKNLTSIVIPSNINEIGRNAFSGNNFKKLSIPSSVEKIDQSAFDSPLKLGNTCELILNEGLKEIGPSAFKNKLIESVILPKSVIALKNTSFMSGTKVIVTDESQIEKLKPARGDKYVWVYTDPNNWSQSDFVIENSVVKGLSDSGESKLLFENKNLVIPDKDRDGNTITGISKDAFKGCGFESVTLPDSIESIGDSAFAKNKIVYTHLPDSIKSVAGNCFEDNRGVFGVVYLFSEQPTGISDTKCQEFVVGDMPEVDKPWENKDFRWDESTQTVTGLSAYGNIKRLTNKELIVPDTTPDGKPVLNIGNDAFSVPDSAVDTTKFGFDSEAGFTSVEIPASLKTIGDKAFRQNALTNIDLKSITTIGVSAFHGNDLKAVELPDTVTSVGNGCFAANNIQKIKLSKNLTVIPQGCFSMNIRLSHVDIPEGVTEIQQTAFAGARLTELKIPSTVTKIGRKAFHLHHLTELVIPGNVKIIEESAFEGTYKATTLKKLVLEEGVEEIGKFAFKEALLEKVKLPNSLKTLGVEPFRNNAGANGSHIVTLKTNNKAHLKFAKDSTYEIVYVEPPVVVDPPKDPITNNKDNSGNTSTDVNLGDKVTTENGKADVKLDKDLADKVVENATNNKSESVDLNAGTTAGNTTKTELTLPTDTYKDIAEKTDVKKVTVKTDSATVSMDKETVIAIAEQAGSAEEVKLVIETKEISEDKVVIELKLVTSNGEIRDFKGGKVTVTVPVKNISGKKLVAVYIEDNGKYTKIGGELTADKKAFVFETGHFSTYAVMTEEAADAAIKAQEPEQPAKPVVKSVAITSVKAQKKAMKVTWKKLADKVNGYQVRYSTSKSFKASKTLSVKYTKKVNSKTVKKLKSGKRYYVKVRAYVKNADGTYYSKWSKVKSVKVK